MACFNCYSFHELRRSVGTESHKIQHQKMLSSAAKKGWNYIPFHSMIFCQVQIIFIQCDAMSDYAARRDATVFLRAGAYNATTTDITNASGYSLVALGGDWNWEWEHLRNFNYFIENCVDPNVSEDVRNHYVGLAKFFRAYFYFEKVKRYGDVPWIEKALDVEDPELYKARDPRTLVMDNVLADLNFAIQNIQPLMMKHAAWSRNPLLMPLNARICLFEGTFRKYHTELGT